MKTNAERDLGLDGGPWGDGEEGQPHLRNH